MTRSRRERTHYLGCLLGGAIGDALGAPVEFDSLQRIRAKYGESGVTGFQPAYGRMGAITDDTQMTLFTAEGLLRAHNRFLCRGIVRKEAVVARAYRRWWMTQDAPFSAELAGRQGWLSSHRELWSRRSPGRTCMEELARSAGEVSRASNSSCGCGAVMRMAPVGLAGSALDAFETGCAFAQLTHGHPDGVLSAGAFAAIIDHLARGRELRESIAETIPLVRRRSEPGSATAELLEAVLAMAGEPCAGPEGISRLGEGWTGHEALAMGLYAALHARDFRHGVLLAVNHGGDSDSTGSIAGNLLGLVHGVEAIPAEWLRELELRAVIEQVAADLWLHFGEGAKPAGAEWSRERPPPDLERYPPN